MEQNIFIPKLFSIYTSYKTHSNIFIALLKFIRGNLMEC